MKEIIIAIAGAALGSMATVTAASLGYFNKDREMDISMVNISLQILSGQATSKSQPGRIFALRALEKYSKVDIPDDELDTWAREGTIPEGVKADHVTFRGDPYLDRTYIPAQKLGPPPSSPPPCINTPDGCSSQESSTR